MRSIKNITLFLMSLLLLLPATMQAENHYPLKVVTSFSDYAAIAREIGGPYITVDYLSHGDQDPHFVPPKPSLAMKLRDADMFVTTGLDLEMWATTLQDKARNKNIMDGATGYVTASYGIELLQKPTTALSQAEGDIHIYGNPHIHTSPLNWKQISENIMIGLQKVDPDHADEYADNQKAYVDKVDRTMFGDELVDLIGGEKLTNLLNAGTLFDFLDREYQGAPLHDRLGGWLQKAESFHGMEVIAYHKNWAYFTHDFGLNVVGYIEEKPGIPPTPKHVENLIRKIQDDNIQVMVVANYFEKRKPAAIAAKTGIKPLFLPLSVGGEPGIDDNFKLVDLWINRINEAIGN